MLCFYFYKNLIQNIIVCFLYFVRASTKHEVPGPHATPFTAETPPSPDIARMKAGDGSIDSSRLDYDTYMQHRRPGSTIQSDGSFVAKVLMPQETLTEDKVTSNLLSIYLS